MAQVTPSTELHECALRQWEELSFDGDGGVDGGLGGVEWWRR